MIWLLRHGEAADGSPDAERPLTERGEQQARHAGAAMRVLGVRLDGCLSSPKVRSADTARLALAELDGGEVTLEPELGGGPFEPEALAKRVGEEVLLVGHDPDFSMAVHRTTGAQVRMSKGGVAVIHKGELKLLLGPDELAAIAATGTGSP